MVITKHGNHFFKIQFGDTTLAVNPPSKESEMKSARFGANVVLTSVRHPDYSGGEMLSSGDKAPFIISSPGEYEAKNIFVKGFASKTNYRGEEKINTIYFITLEGINLCFLGALDEKNLSSEITETLDNIDILFVPIGNNGVLSPIDAYKLAVKLEPRVIIPTHYDEKHLNSFLKEEGNGSIKPVDKLTIKPKDLNNMNGDIVVLKEV